MDRDFTWKGEDPTHSLIIEERLGSGYVQSLELSIYSLGPLPQLSELNPPRPYEFLTHHDFLRLNSASRSFGSVYKARHKEVNFVIALKEVEMEGTLPTLAASCLQHPL